MQRANRFTLSGLREAGGWLAWESFAWGFDKDLMQRADRSTLSGLRGEGGWHERNRGGRQGGRGV